MSFAKPEDWKRISDALRRMSLPCPEAGDEQSTWVPILADALEILEKRIEEHGQHTE